MYTSTRKNTFTLVTLRSHSISVYYYTSDSLWKIWLVESIQSIHNNSLWTWRDKCNTDLGFDNKQLLDEVEHDIMNYQSRGLCYLPKPKAEADNTDTRFW